MTVIVAIVMFGTAALALFTAFHALPSLATAYSRNDRPTLIRSSMMVFGSAFYILLCLLLASW